MSHGGKYHKQESEEDSIEMFVFEKVRNGQTLTNYEFRINQSKQYRE